MREQDYVWLQDSPSEGVQSRATSGPSPPSSRTSSAPSHVGTPRVPPRTPVIRTRYMPHTIAPPQIAPNLRCLVVDDEPRLRQALVRLMKGEGFTCFEAGAGLEGLEVLEREPVALVL